MTFNGGQFTTGSSDSTPTSRLEQAVSDDKRTGKKRKLPKSQQEEFEETVHESPDEVGIDAPALVQDFLEETYGVEYSIPSCRRLLKEAVLNYQMPRRSATESDKDDQERFHDEIKKKRREMDATVVCIDQTKKSVQVKPRASWFPRDTWPSVDLSGQRNWTRLLGAITEDGDRFSPDSPSTPPPNTRTISFYQYAKSSKMTCSSCWMERRIFRRVGRHDLAASDDPTFVSLSSYSPELNPVKECWRQLQASHSNRFFDSLDELTAAIDTALDQLTIPKMGNYF